VFKQLQKHLSAEGTELRLAAGEGIALLLELMRNDEVRLPRCERGRLDHIWTHSRAVARNTWSRAVLQGDLPEWADLDSLTDLLNELATESSKHRARRERSKQRAAFREIGRAIAEGQPPVESLKVQAEMLDVETWVGQRRVDSLRELLGEGFHIHLRVRLWAGGRREQDDTLAY